MPKTTEKASPTDARLSDAESQIRQGNADRAREIVQELSTREVSRANAAYFANLSWRTGIAELGIRLLNPIVRQDPRLPDPISPEEGAEYAACLIKIGAPEEGLELLKSKTIRPAVQSPLYQSFSYAAQWEYRSALSVLKRYLEQDGLDAYQRAVGKVNLAAALIHERQRAQAEFLLRDLLRETTRQGRELLRGNTLELTAANFILGGQWSKAAAFLSRAESLIRDPRSVDRLFVRKWQTLQTVMQTKGAPQSLAELNRFRAEALTRRHWETLRDCDRYQALVTKDPALFQRLYFGTPYDSFRDRLARGFAEVQTIPMHYAWDLGPDGEARRPTLRLLEGETVAGGGTLKVGQVLHRLLVALGSDFYRPWRIAPLHFRVFPNEFFNPTSSPHRVHEAIRRLREWFVEFGLPLVIEEEGGAYRLGGTRPCRLIIPKRDLVQRKISVTLHRLKEQMGDQAFSLREAADLLKLPTRSLHRVLDEARKMALIRRTGEGRSTRYLFHGE